MFPASGRQSTKAHRKCEDKSVRITWHRHKMEVDRIIRYPTALVAGETPRVHWTEEVPNAY
jgi:hypothetical protein